MNLRRLCLVLGLLVSLLTDACMAPLTPIPEDPAATTVVTEPASTAVPSAEAQPPAEIGPVGIIWNWQSLQDGNRETLVTIPNPDSYRLMLQPDGSFNFRADCNVGSGAYTLDGTSIRLMPGPVTMAACPEGSMADQYLALLAQMDTVAGDGDTMNLTASSDGTAMQFAKLHAVTGRVVAPADAQLPQPADIEIRVDDVSKADAPAEQIGGQIISNATHFPVDFEATYNPTAIDERFSYGLTVRITNADGKLRFINTQSVPVLTRGFPTYNVEVQVATVE